MSGLRGTPAVVVAALAACGVIVLQVLLPIAFDVASSIGLVAIGGWLGWSAAKAKQG